MPRAAIHARVSARDRQDARNQLHQLHDFATASAYQLAPEYIDQERGGTSDRPQFRRLFEDARRRRLDLVLFWSPDQLGREGARKTLNHPSTLTNYGDQFRSFTEQYLDSCGIFREAVISITAVIAKQERVRLSERTRAGLDRARSNGKRLGRPRLAVG